MRKHCAALTFASLVILSLACAAYAELWSDTWTNAAYFSTNGEAKNFRAVQLRSEGRFGIKMGENTNAMPYVVYYGVYGQNPNYWNNNLAYGAGVRAMPFTSFETSALLLEWVRDIKFFGEILSLTFLKDEQTAKANKVKTSDFRFGLDAWHEWNLQEVNPKLFWTEMWWNLTYRNTNFYDEASFTKFQTYVNFLQLKVGRHFGVIKPYAVGYLTNSGSPAVWLNSLYYGVGLRMEPFRNSETAPELLRKFKMFAEAMNISWLADQDPTRPNNDFRFGIEFTYGR